MEAVPVRPYVNDPRHDDPDCLAAAAPRPGSVTDRANPLPLPRGSADTASGDREGTAPPLPGRRRRLGTAVLQGVAVALAEQPAWADWRGVRPAWRPGTCFALFAK